MGVKGLGWKVIICAALAAPTAAVAAVPAVGAAAARPAVPAAWSLANAPAPTSPGGELTGISCTARGFCAAVGRYFDAQLNEASFAEVLVAGAWTVDQLSVPSDATSTYIGGVSCSSATSCVAVGFYDTKSGPSLTFSEQWDGTGWTFAQASVPAGAGDSQLSSVSCSGPTACTAVGNYYASSGMETLAESWDGSSWTLQSTPNPKSASYIKLLGVSCPTSSMCMASGSYLSSSGDTVPLAEEWNGKSWSLQTPLAPFGSPISVLNGISCDSATSCTAVGDYCTAATVLECVGLAADQTLVDRWDGTAWEWLPGADPTTDSELDAVSCVSSVSCAAVGYYEDSTGAVLSLAEIWDGIAWTATHAPSGTNGYNSLAGVSCTSALACRAVGTYWNSLSTIVVLGAVWNGRTWKQADLPDPQTATWSQLNAVSCSAPGTCLAVGQARTVDDRTVTVAESSSAGKWTLQTSANEPGAWESTLSGLSCPSASSCTAVGWYGNSDGSLHPLAENWDGKVWTVSTPPNPGSTALAELLSVSCPTVSSCTAAGYYEVGRTYVPLIETWNGTTWSVAAAPAPTGGYYSILYGVSCPSTSLCQAVGSYKLRSGKAAPPLVETWNGSVWAVAPAAAPAGPGQTVLNSVSCPTAKRCVAVGSTLDASFDTITLAETWNGTRWSLLGSPNPAGATLTYLNGVSCPTATACTAVGATGALDRTPLAEVWTGGTWSLQAAATPTGSTSDSLLAISCRAATTCSAVGVYGTVSADTQSPLAESEGPKS